MIKYQGEEFGTEVNRQTALINNFNKKFDDTKYKLVKVDDRLTTTVASTDYCKLWTIVTIEVIAVLVLILT